MKKARSPATQESNDRDPFASLISAADIAQRLFTELRGREDVEDRAESIAIAGAALAQAECEDMRGTHQFQHQSNFRTIVEMLSDRRWANNIEAGLERIIALREEEMTKKGRGGASRKSSTTSRTFTTFWTRPISLRSSTW